MEKELSAIPTLILEKKNQDRIAKPRTLHHPEVSIFTLYIIKLTIWILYTTLQMIMDNFTLQFTRKESSMFVYQS